ncbi:hypothetical protein B0T25DRAFT_207363 [Lasiosphaeria hispida]|uniref:NB-ARC domain-containing protein n=1 Tax=Lasiosphaeria hispida TaxID=260671 RepID=A0AAJ0HIL6_9PEZI|nr:hypothetical protein B0T25DRAFT_207363 [Lasiosphaeria hispida]
MSAEFAQPPGGSGADSSPYPTRPEHEREGWAEVAISHETQRAGDGSQPRHQTWRIRGVPADFSKTELEDVLQQHPALQPPRGDLADDGHDGNSIGNGVQVHTLAPDPRRDQVATVRFRRLPHRLRTLVRGGQLTIDVDPSLENTLTGVKRKRGFSTIRFAVDQHFHGITVLFAPSTGNHTVDVLAVPGLGGHPYGSFVHKGDGHMWLSESLLRDMPTARVMIYGYESGLQDSISFAGLDDLAGSLRVAIRHLLKEQKHLILIGHSLGGLLIKEALTESNLELDQVRRIAGALFFGVPNDGMDIASLIPMVNDQPNRFLLESLSTINSQVLRLQERSFAKFLDQTALNIFCFYETRLSPTAAQDSAGRWKMNGPYRCLVTQNSATCCLPPGLRLGHSAELPRTHSELVKFASHDPEYDKVSDVLCLMYQGRIIASSTARVSPPKHHYVVPLETVHTYTERAKLSAEIEQKIKIRHTKASIPYAIALYGLGGAGKSQLALAYAEKHNGRYNPILWIDATDEEAVRSSFRRCAAELRLPEERAEKQESILADRVVQAVLRWLRDRVETDDEWLVIIDNADDVSWGIQKIMPKGTRGSVIVTSRDEKSVRLVPGACEPVHVGVMSPVEGVALLLQHLQPSVESASEGIRRDCGKIVQRLGYLALAIDLAGAYIGNGSAPPEHTLSQYLADYDRHRDKLLQMDDFQGLFPTQKTVWTVWDTTLEKIRREHSHLQPELLLTFLAQFKGSIIQDESFRLACVGMVNVDAELDDEANEVMPAGLRQFLPLNKGEWDSFQYRQSRDVLIRYSLLQRVEGQWPGVTMHSLVQWRAMQNEPDRPWRWWYTTFILAACCQMIGGKEPPEFRRHLMVHLPDISENDAENGDWRRHEGFAGSTLGRVYYDEGRWDEAEKLEVQVMETHKTRLGADHPDTLSSMANLASTYWNQGRWEEAEKLEVQVMETHKTRLGADHPDTLSSMASLASTYWNQGRWEEAEKLDVQVVETRKTRLGADHPNTLSSMASLASTYRNQGRWEEAEKLGIQVMETYKTKLGADHPDTLSSMANLASTYWDQGRLEEAEKLEVQVMETSKTRLGADHPDTLSSMANLASTYWDQGRWEEVEKLEVQVMETYKTRLGAKHPDTLSSMASLASTYWNQGQWEEAEKLEVQVMETSKTRLGADHPDTLLSMANLASTYWNQGRWEEAEKLDIQVMETSKTRLGADHPNILSSMASLASIYRNQGRLEEAEKLEVQVMETRKTRFGAKHPDTLASMANLALTYWNQGRWEEAEKLEVQVMETSKTRLGADHPNTLSSMASLASTYRNQGRWEEAEKLGIQVMETYKTRLSADHPNTLSSMANLASTYRKQGRWEEAEKLEVQVMETRKTRFGAKHPDTLASMANLASTYWKQGRWEEAEKLDVQVMETRKTRFGADHPDTLSSMANLASTYRNQGRWEEAEKLDVQVMETSKTRLGAGHPDTLLSPAASAWRKASIHTVVFGHRRQVE